jgi:HSP20 family protein
MLPMLWREKEKEPLLGLRSGIDRLIEDFFSGVGDGLLPRLALPRPVAARELFAPLLDLRETEDALVLEAELPGVKPADIDVHVSDGTLVIRGERRQEKDEKTKLWHRTERFFGRFERLISLPPTAESEKIDAAFKDGVLTVTVPKKPGAKPKAVTIKVK